MSYKINKIVSSVILASAMAVAGGGSMVSASAEAYENINDISILVQGYEWGPGVPKLILQMKEEVSSVEIAEGTIITAGAERTVTDSYPCDEKGQRVEDASEYVAIDLETTLLAYGSPFVYDRSVLQNKWADSYPVTLDCPQLIVDGKTYSYSASQDCLNKRICPDTERFAVRDTFSGTYFNNFTKEEEELTLRMAAYEPENAAKGEKKPLIIWLHGQGEGGVDPDIALLGNEVCALAREDIQKYFTTGEETGAYVLAVQTETYWMDEGDGTNGRGSGISKYTEILMDAISQYVDANPNIDTNRIYLGGCSNGGYMTVNMLVNYPDYFAAAYPCCEAYAFYEFERNEDGTYKAESKADASNQALDTPGTRWMTEEKIEILKNIPMWFTVSINDPVVIPEAYVLPTYQALLQAGAENCWLSVFETVTGTDDPKATYLGHWVWIYLFNDQVTAVQDREKVLSETEEKQYGVVPSNMGGGTLTADGYSNVFEWLNAQSK